MSQKRPFRRFARATAPLATLLTAAALGWSVGAAAPNPAPTPAPAAPVLVELFTSQGCSSCPPADAFLKELAERDDVIALSFHVDYWDRLGWRDPYANSWNTRRQHAYQAALDQPYVYTPQMVVGGREQAVGADRATVGRILDRQRREGAAVALSLERVDSGQARLRIAATPDLTGRLTLFGFDRKPDTDVKAGENAGRRLLNVNVVAVTEDLGRWTGEAVDRVIPLPEVKPGRGYALVLTQEGGTPATRVLAAARVRPLP